MTTDIYLIREANQVVLGITSNTCVDTGAGMLGRVIIVTTNTGGVTILDGTSTTSTAATAIVSLTAAQSAPGLIYTFNWPTNNGITVLPGGGAVGVSFNTRI